MRAIAVALCAVLAAGAAGADEKPVVLKRGPGLGRVEAQCAACHSLDYIEMNAPFLAAAAWDAEVTKMINVFGAPIDAADAIVIGNYLKENYGLAAAPANPRANIAPTKPRSAAVETRSAPATGMRSKTLSQRGTLVERSAPVAKKVAPRAAFDPPALPQPAPAAAAARPSGFPWPAFVTRNMQFHPRPAYAHPSECWTDEGYGRWSPCSGAAGGGAGGGGGGDGGGGGGE